MLKLHHAPNSRSGRIVWLLEELGLKYALNKMEFHPKFLKSDEHRVRHPLGRVPVLEDDDVIIYESGAIVEYILERHAQNRLKPRVSDHQFPNYLQWFHYCEGMVMPPINTIVVQTVLLPPERRDDVVLAQAKKLLIKSVSPINDRLEKVKFLADEFSGADIMLGHAVFMANRLGCVGDDMVFLLDYINRISERPAFVTAISS